LQGAVFPETSQFSDGVLFTMVPNLP